jgi:predicted phage tail protein
MAHDRLSDARLIAPTMPCVPAELPALQGQTLARVVKEFGPPSCVAFIVEVNGAPVLRADWSREIAPGDMIVAIPLPRGGGDGKSILGIVAMIALAAFAPWAGGALAGALGLSSTGLVAGAIGSAILAGGGILINTLLAPKPAATAAAQLEASPTYSTRAQGNQARLFSVIPVQYGEHVMVPDYVSDPYQEFQGNDQFLHLLFGRGLGRSEVAQVRIGETVVWEAGTGFTGALADIEIAFYEPGEQVDLFPVQVETSSEVGGQLLADINWIGPFAAVPAGETSQRLAVDVVLPEGCYELTDSGSQVSATVALRFEYREIDDLGAPVGAGTWAVLADETITLTTPTPQRFTWSLDVPAGRYEVRAQRTNAWSASDRRFDRSEWAGLRAYLDGPQAFDDLSTMAVRVRANEQLTSQSSRQFSIVQTRILPVWTGSAWEEQPTRSIAWAAVDIARNPVYGAGLADSRIDLATFAAYDAFWAGRGDTFNGVFDTRTTRFEAINTVLAAGRASVQFLGNRISLVRDEPRALAAQVFTDRNIARGSLEVDYALQKSDAADDVIVEYMDRTSWKQAEVRCTIAESASEAPARVRLIGPTDRGQAWREGIHLAADNFFRRTKATFRAELEGRLLKRGDVVLVQSEMPQTWGEAGVVRGIAGDDLTLSKEPSTDPLNTYLRVRRRDGGEWGPCKITWTHGSAVVTLDPIDRAAVEAEFGPIEPHLVDDGDEEPTYLLGEGTDYAFRGILVNMVPDGTGAQIELVIDDPAVHAADQGLSVPAAPQPGFLPPSAGAPAIDAMSVHREISVTESLVTVSARHPAGAVSFRAQVSYDGNAWTPVYEGAVPAFSASVRREAFYVRMQAVGDLPGPWRVELVAAAPEEVRFPTNAPIRATELFDAATERAQSAGEIFDGTEASFLEQINRIVTEVETAGRQVDRQERSSENARAAVTDVRQAVVTESGARAEAITAIEAAFNGFSANGFVRFAVNAGALPAGVVAEYLVQLNAGTEGSPDWTSAGFALQILDDLSSRMVFKVDQYLITDGTDTGQPFLFQDGTLYVNSAAIPDLVADKIKAGTITSEDGASWWKLSTPSEFVFEI